MSDAAMYQLWLDVKRVLRRDLTLTDEQVAAECGLSERVLLAGGGRELDTIRAARKDLEAMA